MLVASQTGRQALSKRKINLDDVDEEFGKIKMADNVIALCQTDAEFDANDIRLFLAKVRNEESKKTVHCKVLYKNQKIISRSSFLGSK